MADPRRAAPDLVGECGAFVRYLTGSPPTRRVLESYLAAHRSRLRELEVPEGGRDADLLRLARRGPRWTWLVDCYVRRRAPACLVRKKLTLLVAVLECVPGAAASFRDDSGSPAPWVAARLAARGAGFVAGALFAHVLLPPVLFFLRTFGRAEADGSESAPDGKGRSGTGTGSDPTGGGRA